MPSGPPQPSAERPKEYAFFQVQSPDPEAPDELRRGATLFDYGRGGNRAYDVARMLRDHTVRVEPRSDKLPLGNGYFVIAGAQLAHTYFLIEHYRGRPTSPRPPSAEDLGPASSAVGGNRTCPTPAEPRYCAPRTAGDRPAIPPPTLQ